MRHIIRSLIALVYLASATLAQAGFIINSFQFGASIVFVGCTADASAATTYTFTDHATGTAGARKTIIGVGGKDGATNFSVSSMTVGGAGATEVIDSANAGSVVQSAIYIIDNPSGTTATIAVTFSEGITYAQVCVWAAYDLQSETATDTATEFQTSSAAITLDLDVSTGGIAVGHSDVEENATATWSGMTERADSAIAVDHAYSAADTTATGAPVAVTVDWTGTTDSIGVSASFR